MPYVLDLKFTIYCFLQQKRPPLSFRDVHCGLSKVGINSTFRYKRNLKSLNFLVNKVAKNSLTVSFLSLFQKRKDYAALIPFLPRKHEYVIKVRLSASQRKLYEHYLKTFVFPDGDVGKRGREVYLT